MDPDELTYQIRTHLLYELKWMIFAASQFASGAHSGVYIALIDSATVHARALFEFAHLTCAERFTLAALGGTPERSTAWDRWANNRVMHMMQREHSRMPWPEGLDNDRKDRFMVMADAVLRRLETGGGAIPIGPVKTAYDEVVGAARRYWAEPTESRHKELADLYDNSRDHRPY